MNTAIVMDGIIAGRSSVLLTQHGGHIDKRGPNLCSIEWVTSKESALMLGRFLWHTSQKFRRNSWQT